MMRAGGSGLASSIMRSGSSSLRNYTVYGPLQPVTLPHSPAVRGCVVLSSSPSPPTGGASSTSSPEATTTTVNTYECPHLFVRRAAPKSKATHFVLNPSTIKIEQTCEICGRDRDLHIMNDGYDDAAHDDSVMMPFHEIRYNHRLNPRACSRRRITDHDAPSTPIGGSTPDDATSSSSSLPKIACLNTPPPLYSTFDEEHHRAAGWLPGIRSFRSVLDALGLSPYLFAPTVPKGGVDGGIVGNGEVSAYEAVPFWLVRNTYRLIDQFNLNNVRVCDQPSFCPIGKEGVSGKKGGVGSSSSRHMPYCEAFPPSKEAVAQNRIMRNSDSTKIPAYLYPVLGTWPFFLRTLARVRTVERVNSQLFDRRRAILKQIIGTATLPSTTEALPAAAVDTTATTPAASTPPSDTAATTKDEATIRVKEVDTLLREGLMAVRAAGGAFGSPYEHAFYGSPALVARMRVVPSFFRADYESNLTALVRTVSTFPHATTTTPSSDPNGRLKVRTTSTPDGDGIRVLLVSFSHAPFTPSFVLYADDNLKQLVLTFRGTHSDSNIVTDVHNEGMVVGYGKVGRSGSSSGKDETSTASPSEESYIVPLVVARGFYCLVAPTASTIMHELDTVLQKEMSARGMLDPATANTFGYKLIVTGHSLGGGQALTYVISRLCLDETTTTADASTPKSSGIAAPYLQGCEEWSRTGVQDTGLQNPSNNITFPLLFKPEMLRSGLIQVHAFSPPPVVNGPLRDIINRHVSSNRGNTKVATTPLCSYVFEDDIVPRTGAQPIKEYTDAVHASSIAPGPSPTTSPTTDTAPEDIFGVGGAGWEVKWKGIQQQLQGGMDTATPAHPESELWEDPAIRRYLTRYYVPGDIALLTRDLDSTDAEQASVPSTTAGSLRERQLRSTAHCFYYDSGSSYFPSPPPPVDVNSTATRDADIDNDVDAGGAPLGLPALVGPKGSTDHLLLNYHRAMLSVVKQTPF